MPLLVTGTIGIDTVHTPTAIAEEVSGGSCAYFAAAAAFQHKPVRIVGAVGGDWPTEHAVLLESIEGLCLEGLERRSNSKTFAWGGRYFDNMNQRETLFTELGVLDEAPPEVPDSYSDSRLIFLANSHPAVQLDLLAKFPDRQLAVADTMDLWINIARDELLSLFKEIDGLIINDSEAEQLTEINNPISAALAIIAMGPHFVIIKKGEHGAVLVHRDGIAVVPAFPLDVDGVIDPTGAGDSFAGGFMGYLSQTNKPDFLEAVVVGSAMASFCVEGFGLESLLKTTPSLLYRRVDAIKKLLIEKPCA